MAVAFGANEIKPTATAVFFLKSKCMLYLAELESRELIVLITAAVVGAKDLESFLIAAPRNKPSCINVSGDVSQIIERIGS